MTNELNALADKPILKASRKGACADQYVASFYGIVNQAGSIWTPLIFGTIEAAENYRKAHAVGELSGIIKTHKIVPVDFAIEPLRARAAQGGE